MSIVWEAKKLLRFRPGPGTPHFESGVLDSGM